MSIYKNADKHSAVAAAMRARAAQVRTPRAVRGYRRRGTKFQAILGVGKEKVYLGSFDTAEAATAAYREAVLARQAAQASVGADTGAATGAATGTEISDK